MAVNKVVYGDKVLIDLTNDTITKDALMEGKTAHLANGKRVMGTFTLQNELEEQNTLIGEIKTMLRGKATGAGVEYNEETESLTIGNETIENPVPEAIGQVTSVTQTIAVNRDIRSLLAVGDTFYVSELYIPFTINGFANSSSVYVNETIAYVSEGANIYLSKPKSVSNINGYEVKDENARDKLAECVTFDDYPVLEHGGLGRKRRAGVVKIDTYYGMNVGSAGSAGVLQPIWASNSEITNKTNNRFISSHNVDYALYKSIARNTNTLTDEEKARAQEWLGASSSKTHVIIASSLYMKADDEIDFRDIRIMYKSADTATPTTQLKIEQQLMDAGYTLPNKIALNVGRGYCDYTASNVIGVYRTQDGALKAVTNNNTTYSPMVLMGVSHYIIEL